MAIRSGKWFLIRVQPRIFAACLAFLTSFGVRLVCSTGRAAEGPLQRYSRTELHMGVEFEVVLYSDDALRAEEALSKAMARIAQLDKLLSDYDPQSELSRLSATSATTSASPPREFATKLGDDLWTVLEFSQQLSHKSGGAFDVTIGPLTRLWRRARRWKELPEEEMLAAAKKSVGYQHLRLDADAKTAQLLAANMRLDLGGIAKGYAADEALKAVAGCGVARALVRASGDIVTAQEPPADEGWLVGIAPLDPDQPPQRFVRLAQMAISTSGDARQHLIVDGKRYSHIIDPRTGMPVSGRSSVTVIAPRGMLADGLATAVSVLGPREGLELVKKFPGAELLMVYEDDAGQQTVVETPGFRRFELQRHTTSK